MVDFHNPAVIQEDAFAVVKLWHVVNGIFIWEFFVTLDYEWSVFQRRRPYRWTIWIYSLTRVCTLIAVSLNMLGLDSEKPFDCQVWIIFELTFAYLAFATASLLIVLRIIAVWDRNRIAVAVAMSAWLTNVAFLIHGITQLHATWAPTESVCAVLNPESNKKNIIVTLATDVVLLLTMLVGLLRLRQHGTMMGFGRVLWRQGLIWLLLATVAEVPPAVFIVLNLNDPFNLMFQTPSLVVMSIAATRLYRSLTDFSSSSGFSYDTSLTRSGRTASTVPKRIATAPIIPLDRVEVAVVHRSSEDYSTAHAGQYGSYSTTVSVECQSLDNTLVQAIDNNVEDGVKSG